MITKEQFESGYTYEEYRKLVDDKFAQGLTTGSSEDPTYLEHTKMNVHRMNRWDKTIELSAAIEKQLKELPCAINWLVLAEGWCGDASQNVPFLNKMAEASPNINLRILLRDEHLDIMDQYLTNGGRAIPKLIALDADMNEIGQWGPRPAEIQDMVRVGKHEKGMNSEEIGIMVQKWYAKDKGASIEQEMMTIIAQMNCVLDQ
ncbi:MAG: thioredoxin family protein [Flavobacteriales bacterium]|nr:thioredoxin family protein [Flavobacteriales bacterium]